MTMVSTMARRRLLSTLLLMIVHQAGLSAAPVASVTIDNFSFTPATLTVAAGTTVTWINRDDIPHTIVSPDPVHAVKSPPLDTDDQFTFTFIQPGTHRYVCSLHPHMQGMVIVT